MWRTLCFLVLASTANALSLARAPPSNVAARAPNPALKEVSRVEIEIEQGEPLEKALRRFRKATNMSGHLRLLRSRRTFENAHDKKIRKDKESLMRQARARRSRRQMQ